MQQTIIFTLLSVLVVSLISLLGALVLILGKNKSEKLLSLLVTMSAGVMLGDVFLHLFPELSSRGFGTTQGLAVIVGIIIFILLEKAVHWHHAHGNDESVNASRAYLIIWGDALHNFLDGILIAASFLAGPTVGLATTLAVIFHEIPHEIGDFAILLQAGWKTSKALLYNFLSALTAFAGAIVVLVFSSSVTIAPRSLIAFAASSFLYISLSDLIPEFNKNQPDKQYVVHFIFFIIGIALMYLLLFME